MKEFFALIGLNDVTEAVRKDRKNDSCDMQAWYYQAVDNTYAFGRLRGTHGIREHIPAKRTYSISSGEGIFTINGNNHRVAKGSIVTIPKDATYDFRCVGNKPMEFFVDIGIRLDLDTIPSK